MPDARAARLRASFIVVTVGLSVLGCTPVPVAHYQSLRAAQALASDCQERLHDGAPDFAECIRFVAAHPPASEPRPEWWALGALHYGWLMEDVVSQTGLEGADAEARALVLEAERLRTRLKVPDAALCPLIDIPCGLQAKRRSERLAGR